MDAISLAFPPHAGRLSLSHNMHLGDGHHDGTDGLGPGTAAAYYAIRYPEFAVWVSEEQKAKAFATDSVWCLSWCAGVEKIVGLLGCDLDVVLRAANELGNNGVGNGRHDDSGHVGQAD